MGKNQKMFNSFLPSTRAPSTNSNASFCLRRCHEVTRTNIVRLYLCRVKEITMRNETKIMIFFHGIGTTTSRNRLQHIEIVDCVWRHKLKIRSINSMSVGCLTLFEKGISFYFSLCFSSFFFFYSVWNSRRHWIVLCLRLCVASHEVDNDKIVIFI